ncbi:MAG: HepT-like ribonuclease domain-containing protein [Actinomycetota bacterium]
MRPESLTLFWDVRQAGNLISGFIAGIDEREYLADALRRSAVERQLEIIGEALNSLRKHDPETAERVPDIKRIIGLRNILIHGYAVVDDAVVWAAARMKVPELLASIDAFLDEAAAHDS